MTAAQQWAGAWNAFFFEPLPIHSVALFRIAFGCLLFYDALFLISHLKEYLGPDGMIRYQTYFERSRGRAFSLFLYLPPTMRSVRWIAGLHIVSVALMTVGLFTRISTLLTFVTLRSIVNRNPEINNGGDSVAKIMCFLLIFTPAGHAYSLDAAFPFAPPASLMQAPWALRLMQIQISIIYLSAAYWKLKGATYRNGTAVYYAASNEMYRRFPMPAMLLRTPCVQVLTWGTLALEFALGSLIWIACLRVWLVTMGIAFHLALEYSMNVHLFGWYMIACLLLFVDPSGIMKLV